MASFPDEDAMFALVALCQCVRMEIVQDDRMRAVLVVNGNEIGYEVTGENLDALLEKGMIVMEGDHVHVTESGLYWARRFDKEQKTKAKRRAK